MPRPDPVGPVFSLDVKERLIALTEVQVNPYCNLNVRLQKFRILAVA